MEKRKKPKKKKLPRIMVEWFCGKCHQVHRISLPYRLRAQQRSHVHFGRRNKIKKLDIDYHTTLKELNDFINSLFSERFDAINYVKISYPESLLKKLKKNEELAQKHGKSYELL